MEKSVVGMASILDWLFERAVLPFFLFLGKGLEWLILKPLDLLQLPLVLQVMVVGVLTGILSRTIRAFLRVDEKEAAFQEAFAARKARQAPIDQLDDWKKRDLLYRASDRELDEEYNTYLAQRFARHGLVYLLPILGALWWLEFALPPEELYARQGGLFLLPLPANPFGIEGLSVTLVFLVSYLASQLAGYWLRKRKKMKKIRALCLS